MKVARRVNISACALGLVVALVLPTVSACGSTPSLWAANRSPGASTILTAHTFLHGKNTGRTSRLQISSIHFSADRLSLHVAFSGHVLAYVGRPEQVGFPHQMGVVFRNLRPGHGRFVVSFLRIDDTPGTRPGIIQSFPASAGALFRIDVFDRPKRQFFVAEVPLHVLPATVARLFRSILRSRRSLPVADAATDNGGMLPIIVGGHPGG